MTLIECANKYIDESFDDHFIGVCDKIRRNGDKEEWWNYMMDNKEEITENEFLLHVDPVDILDDGETWEDYKSSLSDDIKFYKTDDIYFFQTAGFEYFWNDSEKS